MAQRQGPTGAHLVPTPTPVLCRPPAHGWASLGSSRGPPQLADGHVGVKWEPPHFPMDLRICPGTLTSPFPSPSPFPNSLGGVAWPSLGFSCDLRVSWCLATAPPPASLLGTPGRAQPPSFCFQWSLLSLEESEGQPGLWTKLHLLEAPYCPASFLWEYGHPGLYMGCWDMCPVPGIRSGPGQEVEVGDGWPGCSCPCLPAPGSALSVQTSCSLALCCPFPPLERIVSYACPLVPSFASGGGPMFGLG